MSELRLFCFPYAGASASVFHNWFNDLNDKIAVIPIEMAGRGYKSEIPFYNSIQEAAGNIFEEIKELLSGNFAFCGYSMGGLVAFELAELLEKHNINSPQHMFIFSRSAPHVEERKKKANLPKDEFIKALKEYGGTSREIFKDERLFNYFSLILRSDFKIIEEYKCSENFKKINSDFSIFFGLNEGFDIDDIKTWKDYTSMNCKIYPFHGGHFLFDDYKSEIINIIHRTLLK